MLCLCFCLYANVQMCKDGLNATDKIVFVEQPENSQQQPAARKPRIAGWALGVGVRVQLWLGPFLVRWAMFWYIVIDILLILLIMQYNACIAGWAEVWESENRSDLAPFSAFEWPGSPFDFLSDVFLSGCLCCDLKTCCFLQDGFVALVFLS